MARTGKRKKTEEASRPSTFFIIALVLGFAVLVWWFMHFLPKPAQGGEQEQKSRISVTVEPILA